MLTKDKATDGLEHIKISSGYYVITATGEIRIPGEMWYPEDDEFDKKEAEERYRKIPKILINLSGERLRSALYLVTT